MKANEIRELSPDDVAKRMQEARQELFNLRFQHATGALRHQPRQRTGKLIARSDDQSRAVGIVATAQHHRKRQIGWLGTPKRQQPKVRYG